ncbi:Cyclin-T1-2 [Dactylellina cionopaga]|nr:Cyclin-T1-2 [Dactylellina cionopaga]
MAHRDDGISTTSKSHDDDATPQSASSSGRKRTHPHLLTKNAASFMALLADILRLQEQSLAIAYLYMHKYRKFIRESERTDPIPDFLDPHTLALTCLSLSTKSTESPRRLRSLITPAYSLLHPSSPPIRVPSHLYDTLRATIVTAELHLLRILKFELRVAIPHDYIPRMLDAALSIIPGEDYETLPTEKMEEDKVSKAADTFLGRQCAGLATKCLARYSVANFYDAKTIACGVVGVVLEGNGVVPGEGVEKWVRMVAGRDMDLEDYNDVVKEVGMVYGGNGGVTVQEIKVIEKGKEEVMV